MKKVFVLLLALGLALPVLADDRPIGREDLPTTARNFVDSHFGHTSFHKASVEPGLRDTEYQAHFVDGTKIKFNNEGEWKKIEARDSYVPETALPEKIREYIHMHYPNHRVVEIEHDNQEYEVELNNGRELKFNRRYELIEVD